MKKEPVPEMKGVNPQKIIHSLSQWILRVTPQGFVLYANPAFCNRHHKELEQILQENVANLFSKDRLTQFEASVKNLSPVQPEFHYLINVRIPDAGEENWEYWIDQGIFSQTGELLSIQIVGFEIQTPISLTGDVFTFPSEFQALHDATTALLSTLDLEKLLGRILDAASRAVPAADKGMLYLIARDTGELEMRAMLGYTSSDPRIQRFVNPNEHEIIAKVVQSRSPLLLKDMNEGRPPTAEVGKENLAGRSAIIAPLVLEGHAIGAVVLEASQRNAFTEKHLKLLTTFATTATAAIRNAQLHAEVQKIAITDALTGLYNRRGFFELGEREVERAHRFRRPLSAVMLDIDGFKQINDTFGHAAGDKILRYVAEQCKLHTRKIDIIGRYGGDEFAILLLESDEALARGVANRLQKLIRVTPLQLDESIAHVTLSIGVATLREEFPNLEALLQAADRELYLAKQNIRSSSFSS